MLTTAANYADFTPFRGRFAYRQRAKSVPEELFAPTSVIRSRIKKGHFAF
jgi:hypothetical protein